MAEQRQSANWQFNESWGRLIAQARESKGLTKQQIASAVDLSVSMITNMERGVCACPLYNGLKLITFLGINTHKHFGAKVSFQINLEHPEGGDEE